MNHFIKYALFAVSALALAGRLSAQSTQIIRVEIASPTNESATAYSPTASPASATATVAPAGVLTTTITNPGAGYTTASVTVTGGGVTGATGTATVGAAGTSTAGMITAVTITPTTGYTSIPTITIDVPTGGVLPTTPAVVTPTISAGTLTGITVSSPGSGYLTTPTVTLTGGGATTQGTATATIANGTVTGITVNSAGSGYTSAPTVFISAPPGLVTVSARVIGVAAVGTATTTFFANGRAISPGLPGTTPTTAWAPPQPGAYFITAQTTDSFGNSAVSQAARIFVTGAKIFSPIAHTAMPLGSSMVISGDGQVGSTATNPFTGDSVFTPGFIRNLKFEVFDAGGTSVSSQTAENFPYSVQFTPPALGFYRIVVTATDNNDQTYTGTDLVDIQVVRAIGTPPFSRIVNPIAGGSVASGSAVNIIADAGWSATDQNAGKIAKVEFYLDGRLLSSSSAFPFTSTWTPTVPGRYTLVAVAYDDKGNVVTSSPAAVNVVGGLPTVALTSPASAGVSVVQGTRLTVAVSAAGSDGGITSLKTVEFLVDGTVNDSLPKADPITGTTPPLSEPFNFTWRSNVSLGVHRLAARVTDKNNLTITSAEVPVTVIANQLPTVSVNSPVAGMTFAQNTAVTISASPADPDGSVESVEFFVNGVSLGAAVTKAPFQITWTPTNAGPYVITAKVTDNAGATTTSSDVAVTVEAPQSTEVGGTTSTVTASVYRGIYQSPSESGSFALGVNRNNRGTFIAFSSSTPTKTYFWTDIPVGSDGTFIVRDAQNAIVLSGQTSATGVSGTFGDKNFIGPISVGSITPLALTGSFTGVPNSQVVALVGGDGFVTFFTASGTTREAGSTAVTGSGNFSFAAPTGGQFTGTVSSSAGIVGGSVSGTQGGSFLLRQQPGRLTNISTRAVAGAGERTLVAGFVVSGTGSKPLFVRAIGPTLANFGVASPLADPSLSVTSAAGATVASNNDWGNSAALANIASQVGAFPLAPGSRDAALQVSVNPGTYSAMVGGATVSGAALIEIYDTDGSSAPTSRITNISTRGQVVSGEPLIAGFVITGDQRKKLLIRAVGPTLGGFGITGALADPRIEVFSGATSIAANNDWTETSSVAPVTATTPLVGAFALNANSRDAALVLQLSPGSYTVQVTGVGGGAGTVLVEIYDADQ